MGLKDSDSHSVWDELCSRIDEFKNDNQIDVQLIDDSFHNKCKELNKMVKEIKSLNKEKSKVELELESVEKSVIKAQNNITNAEDKCQHFQEYNNKISKKIEENKENIANAMNAWNSIGLRLEHKDNLFTFKFNKILESEPNKWFTVRVSLRDNAIKVLDCDPKESLDLSIVEDRFNRFNKTSAQQKPDLRHLIAFIRSNLKRNTSH